MRTWIVLFMVGFVAGVTGCNHPSSSGSDSSASSELQAGSPTPAAHRGEEGAVSVPLAEVPAAVMSAAQGAVSGIVFTRAKREFEHGRMVYDMAGTMDGQAYEVEVTESGKVLEIELEDGDDGDDNDDDNDGDDDDDNDDGDDD